MKPSLFLVILLFCLLHFYEGTAQEPVQLHFTEKEGLPDREFYSIIEDQKGFIWLAGNKGLTRYNGTTFKTFEHPEKRRFSVFSPVLDENNTLWCTNISGQIFRTNEHALELFADVKEVLHGSLGALHIDEKYIYVATNFVIISIDRKTGEQFITNFKSDVNYAVGTVINKKLHVVINNSLYTLNRGVLEAQKTLETAMFSDPNTRIGRGILVPLTKNSQLLYFQNELLSTKQCILFEDRITPIIFPDTFKKERILKIKAMGSTIWVLTSNGAYKTILSESKLIIEEHYFSGIAVTDIIEDRDSNMWFSTLREGVYILPNLYIRRIKFEDNLKQPSNMISGKEDTILIGFINGDVMSYNTKTGEKIYVDLPEGRPIAAMAYNAKNEEYLILQEIKNYVSSATTIQEFKKINSRIITAKHIEFLKDGSLALVNSGRGMIIDKDYYNTELISKTKFKKEKRGYTLHVHPSNNHVYFGLVDELIALDNDGNETQIVDANGNQILTESITTTKDGHTWVASFSNGIYEIDGTKVIQHITFNEGLLDNRTFAIAAQNNYLWVATASGLQQIKKQEHGTFSFKALKKQDGIPSYDIKDIVVKNNRVFICTADGVFSIDAENSFKNITIPEPYITQISIDNKKMILQDRYELMQEESATSIQFNVNGLRGLSNGKFAYRIKEVDARWTAIKQGVNEIQYARLPIGSFSFELGIIDGKNPIRSSTQLMFNVKNPFYKTLFFWILVGATLLLLLFWIFWLNHKKEAKKQLKKMEEIHLDNELNILKLENLRSQMNPHFIFNALNSIQEYIEHNEKDLASSYLVKFSRLIRMYLDQSRENNISLTDELQTLSLYLQLEKIRFEDSLEYTMNNVSEMATNTIKVPPLFIQPYVENAIKHGLLHRKNNRKLNISFNYLEKDRNLVITIEDNGVGRMKAMSIKKAHPQYHRSFATYANNERVQLLNKNRTSKILAVTEDLYQNELATGTRIILTIPQ